MRPRREPYRRGFLFVPPPLSLEEEKRGGGERKEEENREESWAAQADTCLSDYVVAGYKVGFHRYMTIHPSILLGERKKRCLSYFFPRMLRCAASVRPPLAAPLDKSGVDGACMLYPIGQLVCFFLSFSFVQGFSFLLHLGHASGQAFFAGARCFLYSVPY